MVSDVMFKMIMEDLATIKESIQIVIRTEETVRIQQKQLAAIFKKLETHETRLANNEIAVTGNTTNNSNMRSAIAWLAAFTSAFLIAVYLGNTKPVKAAIINKEPSIKVLKIEKKGKE